MVGKRPYFTNSILMYVSIPVVIDNIFISCIVNIYFLSFPPSSKILEGFIYNYFKCRCVYCDYSYCLILMHIRKVSIYM